MPVYSEVFSRFFFGASAEADAVKFLTELGVGGVGRVYLSDDTVYRIEAGAEALEGDLSLLHPALTGISGVHMIEFFDSEELKCVEAHDDGVLVGDLSAINSRLAGTTDVRSVSLHSNGEMFMLRGLWETGTSGEFEAAPGAKFKDVLTAKFFRNSTLEELELKSGCFDLQLVGSDFPAVKNVRQLTLTKSQQISALYSDSDCAFEGDLVGFDSRLKDVQQIGHLRFGSLGNLIAVSARHGKSLVGDLASLNEQLAGIHQINEIKFYTRKSADLVSPSYYETVLESDLEKTGLPLLSIEAPSSEALIGDLEKLSDKLTSASGVTKVDFNANGEVEFEQSEYASDTIVGRTFIADEDEIAAAEAKAALLAVGIKNVGEVVVGRGFTIERISSEDESVLSGDLSLIHESLSGFENVETLRFSDSGALTQVSARAFEELVGDFGQLHESLKQARAVFRVYLCDDGALKSVESTHEIGIGPAVGQIDPRLEGLEHVYSLDLYDGGALATISAFDRPLTESPEKLSPELVGIGNFKELSLHPNGAVKELKGCDGPLSGPLSNLDASLSALSNIGILGFDEEGSLTEVHGAENAPIQGDLAALHPRLKAIGNVVTVTFASESAKQAALKGFEDETDEWFAPVTAEYFEVFDSNDRALLSVSASIDEALSGPLTDIHPEATGMDRVRQVDIDKSGKVELFEPLI